MPPDDTVAAKLPRLNVPGMQTPPPQPPGLDPMEGLKNVARDAANSMQPLIAAGRAESQRIQAIDNTQTERPGTVMGGVQNLGARIKNGMLDAGVLSPDIVSRAPILTPD